MAHTQQIRQAFLRYFEKNGHKHVESASLIPSITDPSLLFINAGMAPHKKVFLGQENAMDLYQSNAIVSCQRCVRAGGKHNDLDQVGHTPRHHTLFEMLGNFSFNDYFKEQAIFHAWHFLTEELLLNPDKIRVSVLDSDTESYEWWKKIAKLPESSILQLDRQENFWSMGETGPCGPCTEIFYDINPTATDEENRWLEIWNLVFMQYQQMSHTTALEPLPNPCVDTGMGLERIASVLQGVTSNFHTDAFIQLIAQTLQIIHSHGGHVQDESIAQVIADHVRAATILIADGVYPSSEHRGYVVRRIIRRAIRYGHKAGIRRPFLHELVPNVAARFAGHSDKLTRALDIEQIQRIMETEQVSFFDTLDRGIIEMEKLIGTNAKKELSPEQAFLLYDTHGLPLDIIQLLAKEHQLPEIDLVQFNALLDEQRQRARSNFQSTQAPVGQSLPSTLNDCSTEFSGYTTLEEESKIMALNDDWVAISPCPFYAQGGGQVGDVGFLQFSDIQVPVKNVQSVRPDLTILQIDIPDGMQETIVNSTHCQAVVDECYRKRCSTHHSATHLLHAALSSILGNHVSQAGSLVDADRLRFDFTHTSALTDEQLKDIESRVNQYALSAFPVTTNVMDRSAAEDIGAKASFVERYSDRVRVVSIGDVSTELCGGTHVTNVSMVWPFCIHSEGSIASGTRRIEATAGESSVKYLLAQQEQLMKVGSMFGVPPAHCVQAVHETQQKLKHTEASNEVLLSTLATTPSSPVFTGYMENWPVCVHVLEPMNVSRKILTSLLKQRAEFLVKENAGQVHIIVLGEHIAVKSSHRDIGSAKEILAYVAAKTNIRGGGSHAWAQGKGSSTIDITGLLEQVEAQNTSALDS